MIFYFADHGQEFSLENIDKLMNKKRENVSQMNKELQHLEFLYNLNPKKLFEKHYVITINYDFLRLQDGIYSEEEFNSIKEYCKKEKLNLEIWKFNF